MVGVLALPDQFVTDTLRALPTSKRPWGHTAAVVQTPLVNGMIFAVDGTAYIVGGPVTVKELDRVAADIVSRGSGDRRRRTERLTKRFPEGLVAVDHLDLEVHEGDLFGFLGPNGAGKSTTIRMLLGLVFPTTGSGRGARAGRAPPRSEALLDVGSLVEGPGFYPHLSGRRNLALFDAAGRRVASGTRRPHRGRAGTGRPRRRGPPPGQGVLDGHAPAARPRRGPAAGDPAC